jgi:hypothetical protein
MLDSSSRALPRVLLRGPTEPVLGKIQPSRIYGLDQANLFNSGPTLELTLAAERCSCAGSCLEIDQLRYVVLFCEARNLTESMLVNAPDEVTSDSDIEHP